MTISVEISLYPLKEEYGALVNNFLEELQQNKALQIETSAMSTLILGDFEAVMPAISAASKKVFETEKAVFVLKISNGCVVG